MNGIELLWRIIMFELIILLAVLGVLVVLLIWWLLRKLVVVPTVTVATDQASYGRGETVGISGSVMDGTNPLPGETVALTVQPPTGDAISLPSATTDSDGNFSASWVVPIDAEAGSYELFATCLGVGDTTTFTLKSR